MVFALLHPVHDFVEYWTASHLLMSHQDPYSLTEVFHMEKALGFEQSVPIMFLSPPWSLPLLAPLGLAKSYGLAWAVWLAILVGAVALASHFLMDLYFGDLRIPEISDTTFCRCLFAFTFYPVLLCLRFTQTAPVMLLGIVGFLYFERKGRLILAGAFLSLTLIKPQLLFLVWLAVVFQSFRQRRWKLLGSTVAATVLLSGVALLLDPHAFHQYRTLAATPYFEAYASGVTAGLRKLMGGEGTFWIQWVPPLFGLSWFVMYWRRYRANWSWRENLPMVMTVSVLTSAYGWLFDQTLLALPVIAIAGNYARASRRLPRNLVIVYTALNCALMLLMPIPTLNLLPAPILITVLLMRQLRAKELVMSDPALKLCAE